MSTVSMRIGRLGVLAVGVGLGAAVAVTPGVAAPGMPDIDVSMDGVTLSAFDMDISIWGVDVFHSGSTAVATSTVGNMAFAFGPNAHATAEGGFGDFASADSTGAGGAYALAGQTAAGATGNNFDFASAVGQDADSYAGDFSSAPDTTGSSFDFASASGNFAVAEAGNPGGPPDATGSSFDLASASGGGGTPATFVAALAGLNGSGDSASAIGQNVEAVAGDSSTAATPANFDSASALGNLSAPTTHEIWAVAGSEIDHGGSNDTAFVDDLFGTMGSSAIAGEGHSFDLAGALGDALNPTSIGADFVFHIAPFF